MTLGDGISIDLAAMAIANAVNAGDHETAFSLLGRFTGDDLQTVAARAKELGADPASIDVMVQTIGSGETIVISSKPPSTRVFPRWPLVVAAAVGLAAGAYFQATRLVK